MSLKIIDVDSHITEPHDLWSKRAPAKYKSRLPRVEKSGEDNVLFETDFPHPTCLYPNVQEHIAEVSRDWSETRKRKILQDNAAALYKIPV